MALLYIPNGHKIHQNFQFPDPPKFTQILIEKMPSGNLVLESRFFFKNGKAQKFSVGAKIFCRCELSQVE
jgi:hypothetical protein